MRIDYSRMPSIIPTLDEKPTDEERAWMEVMWQQMAMRLKRNPNKNAMNEIPNAYVQEQGDQYADMILDVCRWFMYLHGIGSECPVSFDRAEQISNLPEL